MHRRLTTVLLVALLVLMPAPQAHAGWVWCPGDPVIQLNGTLVDITVAIPIEYVLLVNGPVRYEIQTPVGVDRRLVVADLGYGQGNEIVFTDSSEVVTPPWIPTTIIVHVPIDASQLLPGTIVPAQLRVTPLIGSIVTTQGTSQLVTAKLDILGQEIVVDNTATPTMIVPPSSTPTEVNNTATPTQSPSRTSEPTLLPSASGTPGGEPSATVTPTDIQGEIDYRVYLPVVQR